MEKAKFHLWIGVLIFKVTCAIFSMMKYIMIRYN